MTNNAHIDDFIQQLRAAVPSLMDADFATSDYHTDVYVVIYPEVTAWLQTHYRWWNAVTTFRSPNGSAWNGAGKLCYDIPFGNGAAWNRKLSAGAKHD